MSRRNDQPQRTTHAPGAPDSAPVCAICGAPADQDSEAFPFCSRRCRLIDLGKWLGGAYVVSRPLTDDDLTNHG
jgi:endogenous inhibitor of DNA gyrase (YacG/DUF329 family)